MELHSPLGYRPKWQSKHSIEHYVVFICTNLSILFLVLKISVFCVYKEARRSSSVCIMCLVVTLLVAQVLLLVTKCANLAKYFCFTGAVLAHYFFLSTFLWTCVLSLRHLEEPDNHQDVFEQWRQTELDYRYIWLSLRKGTTKPAAVMNA
ncbi:hypothetical protein MRX96_024679 [Rhipicephalus microplus]